MFNLARFSASPPAKIDSHLIRKHPAATVLAAWLALAGATGGALSPEASALDRDTRAVITGGEYGLLVGTLAGLASLPLHRDLRGVFIGSSVGLYLGIAVGFYHVFHRDDPQNPLRSGAVPADGGSVVASARAPEPQGALTAAQAAARAPVASVELPVLRF